MAYGPPRNAHFPRLPLAARALCSCLCRSMVAMDRPPMPLNAVVSSRSVSDQALDPSFIVRSTSPVKSKKNDVSSGALYLHAMGDRDKNFDRNHTAAALWPAGTMLADFKKMKCAVSDGEACGQTRALSKADDSAGSMLAANRQP